MIITDENGDIVGYNPENIESNRLQKTLFQEKQTIIENCLFGVDLNPNSVRICRLRLWIELLKNAYYKTDPRILKLQKLGAELFLRSNDDLFNNGQDKRTGNGDGNGVERDRIREIEAEITAQTQGINEEKSNAIYTNAFEWRFEFPEVLSNNGDFEGFDLIIGNPPYISAMELKKSHPEAAYKVLKHDFETAKGTVDLFIYFFEKGLKLLKNKGQLCFISPNRYLSASYGEALRKFLYKQARINEIVDYSHVKVFKEASTYPVVTSLTLDKSEEILYNISVGKYDDGNSKINFKKVSSEKLNFLEGYIWGYLLNDKMKITEEIINNSVPTTECAIINATSTASEADEYHYLINQKKGFKLINTGTIDRYESHWGKVSFIDKGEKYLNPYLPKDDDRISKNRNNLYSSPKIVLAKIAITTEAVYDEKGEYASIYTNCFHSFKNVFDPKFVLAWLN